MSEIGRLTAAETLVVNRRRVGSNQRKMAEFLGVSSACYIANELGLAKERGVQQLKRAKVGRLQKHERCFLYRRRAGKSQAQVAVDLERCRWWVNKMEHGSAPCDDLLWYWEQ